MSQKDIDSSAASILGVCLDGFDEDACMSDAEGAHDDMQIGEAAGDNHLGNIPWRTTAWRAGAEDVGSVKTAKTVDEGRKQPSSGLSVKTVTLDVHETAPREIDGVDGGVQGRVEMGDGNTVDIGVQLTREQKKQRDKAKAKSPSAKKSGGKKGGAHQKERHARQLASLSRP